MTFVLFVHRHQRKTDMDPYDRLQAIKESSLKEVGKDFASDALKIARSLPIAVRDIGKHFYKRVTGKLPRHTPGIESAPPEEFMKHFQKKEQTPKVKEISQAIDKAGNSTENYKKVAARLKAHYDNEDSRGSPFGRSILDSFNPSENPNARIEQAGARGREALENAGVKFKFRQAIGSLNRKDNHYIVSSKDVEAAEKALKGVSNAQVKTK